MKNKIIIESNSIYQLGLSKEAFKASDAIVIENDSAWHRVSKPRDGKPKVVILWSKTDDQDSTPTEAKIVSYLILWLSDVEIHLFGLQFGAAVYNGKELTEFASEHTQSLVEVEMKALMNDLQSVFTYILKYEAEICFAGLMRT